MYATICIRGPTPIRRRLKIKRLPIGFLAEFQIGLNDVAIKPSSPIQSVVFLSFLDLPGMRGTVIRDLQRRALAGRRGLGELARDVIERAHDLTDRLGGNAGT